MVETGDRTPDWDVSTGALQDQATDEASSGLDGLGVDEYDVSVADLKEAGAGGDGYERQVIQWINELDERIAKHCDALTQKSLVFRPDRTPVLTQPMSPEKTPKLAFPQRNPFRLHVPSSTPNHSLTPSTNPTSHELPFKPDLLTHPAPIPPSPDELLEAPEHPIALAQPRAAARALSLSDRCQQQPSTNPERGTPPHLDTPTATPATPEHKAYPLTPPATEASGLRGGVGGGAFTVTTSGLSADERIMVETRCHELSNVRYVEACELTDDVNVLITSDPAPRTVKYCLSLVRGLWIVAVGWLTHPTETSLPNYEVQGDSGKGAEKSRAPTLARWAKKARVAGEGQFTSPFDGLPKPALLLEGSAVSLVGPFRALSEETVAGLCAEAGAVVVQRYDPASRLKHIAICEARERLQAANDAADHRAPSRRAMALRTLLACICRWAPDL
ncbi:hypothetical protein DIPPA_23949 [Diplonema papillatum]|nr:hypothetical protein DIPPA_23949 [Diplonema papillatum]